MGMFLGHLALAAAAAFAGAALYINVAEHPARAALDDQAQLAHWKPSYAAALKMQVALAVGSALLGLAAWLAGGGPRWIAGALLILANLPVTMLLIMPTNRVLKATPTSAAGSATRALLDRWARLHAVRSGLGLCATAAYVWAAG